MRQFSVWTAPLFSFFSRDLYADVAQRWRAKAFAYLLLVVVASWIPAAVQGWPEWSEFRHHDAPDVIRQIPPITIDAGVVSTDVEQPYYIRRSESDELFAIIDTTGMFTSLGGTSADVLLTDSKLMIKKSDTETRVYDLSAAQEFYVDSATAEGWLSFLGSWGLAIIAASALAGSYIFRVLQALLYSVFGLLFAKVMKRSMSWDAILRVAVVAITPAFALRTFLGVADVHFGYSWVVFFLVAMAYLAFGVYSNRDDPRHSEAPSQV